jgi:hypothetical protein
MFRCFLWQDILVPKNYMKIIVCCVLNTANINSIMCYVLNAGKYNLNDVLCSEHG